MRLKIPILKRMLVVSKNDPKVQDTKQKMINILQKEFGIDVVDESEISLKKKGSWEMESPFKSKYEDFGMILSLGGDGTLLKVSSMFPKLIPPVISFSMGTVGFLTQHDVEKFEKVIKSVLDGKAEYSEFARIEGSLSENANGVGSKCKSVTSLNEILLHRGRFGQTAKLDIFLDDQFFTTTTSDGIIVATPVGSTAYSMSAGGSMVHPAVNATLITPVCPRSLSFRPVLLPSDVGITIKKNRAAVSLIVDGMDWENLDIERTLRIRKSEFPMPIVHSEKPSTEWINRINRILKWNNQK